MNQAEALTQSEIRRFHAEALGDLMDTGLRLNAAIDDLGAELRHAGLGIAETVDLVDKLVGAFERNARAVRRTILLRDTLVARAHDDADRRVAARREIIRRVEDAIVPEPAETAERLEAELVERLDSPEIEDDLRSRPVPDIIADIRRDLGLSQTQPTTRRRAPADIVRLHAHAAQPRAVYATPPTPNCPSPSPSGRGSG